MPNAGSAQLSIGGRDVGPAVDFGGTTEYVAVPAGSVTATVTEGGDRAGRGTLSLDDGERYTVVALARDGGAELRAFHDEAARGGTARLRVVGAAPELGSPVIRLGGRTIAEGVDYKDGTDYLSVSPGRRELAVTRPGEDGGVLVSRQVTLAAGTAVTAYVIGTRGERTRILTLEDAVLAPPAAPHTGLGGLSGGESERWAWILLAALAGGFLGGGTWLVRGRASR